jgi:hypothetical protein
MMMLNVKALKLIVLGNACVVRSSDEIAAQNFFINYNCFFSMWAPVCVSLCRTNVYASHIYEKHSYLISMPNSFKI